METETHSREFPRVITASLREAFNSCYKKFEWSQVVGLASKGSNQHLTAGKAYATGLEAYRSTYWGQETFPTEEARYDAAVARGLIALTKEFGAEDPPPEQKKQYDRVVAAYVEHLVRYPPTREHCTPHLAGRGVEFSFAFEIADLRHPQTGDPLLYGGRLDQLADYNAAIFVFDDKSASGIGPQWTRQWDLRSQFTGYACGMQLSGYPVVGAVIRGMTIAKEECKTAEAITYRPDWMIERWKTRLIWDMKRMLQCWETGYFPHTGEESGACYDYGICPFATLCGSSVPEKYIDVYFNRERWDPVSRESNKS